MPFNRSSIARALAALILAAAVLAVPPPTRVAADPSGTIPGTARVVAGVLSTSLSPDSRGHSCAIDDSAQLRCWGSGDQGQLGQGGGSPIGDQPGEMGDALSPVDLGTGRTATSVSAGWLHTCVLLDNGTVKCWGDNTSGQLGQGDTVDRGLPGQTVDNLPAVNLGTGRTATAITSGTEHTCALLDNGTIKCWGEGNAGKLGQGSTDNLGDQPGEMGDNLPAVDLGTGRTATAISSGGRHTCALLDNGTTKCWGSGTFGQLGSGGFTGLGDDPGEMGDNLPPVDLGSGRTAISVDAGWTMTCALLDDGTVKCWGGGFSGQTGQGDTTARGDGPGEMGDNLPPVDLGSGRTATSVVAGTGNACALLDDGTVKCWGDGFSGRLGQGDTTDRGDDPGEMGDNLPPIGIPVVADAWIACHTSQPVGYWLGESDGTLYPFGDADPLGKPPLLPAFTLVDVEATPTGCGYWTLVSNGTVDTFGDATDLGDFNLSTLQAGEKLASFSPTPSGRGLWAFTDRGRVLTLGDAKPKFAGAISDLTSINLAGPIIDSIPTPSGEGYYMLGSDGGVFAFGDATFVNSLPGLGVTPDQPTVGLVPDPDGSGYWMVAADGGVFAFNAPFVGSLPGLGITQLQAPVIGMTPYADGYLQVASDGGVFNFSSQPFSGSLGDNPPDTPIVAITPTWKN